ncbi:MAG: hypothetical protein D6732_08030 [Methanobacteriota archaeon]|nr:MAG: hypothetical protein D6732_08030 [Euryarchaeota archaeon]
MNNDDRVNEIMNKMFELAEWEENPHLTAPILTAATHIDSPFYHKVIDLYLEGREEEIANLKYDGESNFDVNVKDWVNHQCEIGRFKNSFEDGFICGYRYLWWWAVHKLCTLLGEGEENKISVILELVAKHACICNIIDGRLYLIRKPANLKVVQKETTKFKGLNIPVFELHSEPPEPTFTFAGVDYYYYHDLELPKYLGSTPKAEWKPEWVLSEKNTEVRRVILEVLGYEKVIEALEMKKISEWREYELYELDLPDEPLHLLKMVCPSTGRVYVEGVPPNITDAEEARKWQLHVIGGDWIHTEPLWEA